jgi:glucan-binding YG repeat protein
VEGQDGYERSRGVTTLDNALLLFQTQVYRRFDDFSSRLGSLESRLNEKLLELQKEKFVYDDKVRDLEKQASRAVSEYQKSKKNVVDLSAEVRKNKMKIELLSSQLEFYRQGLSKRNLKDQKLADQNKE